MTADSTPTNLLQYQPQADFLRGKNLLVTGAANGIGRAVSIACASWGATVVLLDVDGKGLKSVYDEISSNEFPEPVMVPLDFQRASAESWEELAAKLADELGDLHGLIHCAADVGILCPLELYDLETWQRVVHVNFTSAFLLTRACVPLLKETGNASIIFSTSDVANKGRANWGAYAVAGHALEGLAQVWAHELSGEFPVGVNLIDPGVVATKVRKRIYPMENPETLPQPTDVVPLYAYVLEKSMQGNLSGVRITTDGQTTF